MQDTESTDIEQIVSQFFVFKQAYIFQHVMETQLKLSIPPPCHRLNGIVAYRMRIEQKLHLTSFKSGKIGVEQTYTKKFTQDLLNVGKYGRKYTISFSCPTVLPFNRRAKHSVALSVAMACSICRSPDAESRFLAYGGAEFHLYRSDSVVVSVKIEGSAKKGSALLLCRIPGLWPVLTPGDSDPYPVHGPFVTALLSMIDRHIHGIYSSQFSTRRSCMRLK